MGEFDLSLIREFRNRPAFYDRNSALFKDKVFTAREWQLIANKLGYDVSLLKDRMLQLRNRYNLEKRRLEQLRDENPGKNVVSPWPLYNQLHFLSKHIRTRRSYKRMMPMHDSMMEMPTPPDEDQSYSGSEYTQNATGGEGAHEYPNVMVTVKMEEDGEVNNGMGCDASATNTGSDFHASPPSHVTRRSHLMHQQQKHSNTEASPPAISIRCLDTMRSDNASAITVLNQGHQQPFSSSNGVVDFANKSSTPYRRRAQQTVDDLYKDNMKDVMGHNKSVAAGGGDADLPICSKRRCLSRREQKYAAFGNFMSASLLELPPKKALLLLEKFTSEIVRVIIEKGDNEKTN